MIFSTTLSAEEKVVTMQTFLDGINLVKLGILTNTKSFVLKGVSEVKASAGVLCYDRPLVMPSFDEARGHAYTKKNMQQLNMQADKLLRLYKTGDVSAALNEYNAILQQCVECHSKLRDYKDRGHGFR